jgi:hypothetical protein
VNRPKKIDPTCRNDKREEKKKKRRYQRHPVGTTKEIRREEKEERLPASSVLPELISKTYVQRRRNNSMTLHEDDGKKQPSEYEQYITREYQRFQKKKGIEVPTTPVRQKRSPAWYRNCKALAEYRRKLEQFYQNAADIDVEEIVGSSKGTQYAYELLCDGWKRVQMILDMPDLHASETHQNQALCVLRSIVAELCARDAREPR